MSTTTRPLRHLVRTAAVTAVLAAAVAGTTITLDPSSAAAATTFTVTGQRLAPGAVLRSPNGQVSLTMQLDGNLALTGPRGLLWWAGRSVPGSEARVQADGNLAIYGPAGQLLWFATGAPTPGAVLGVDDDGTISLRAGQATSWAAPNVAGSTQALTAGQSLRSPDGRVALTMQADGNLALTGPGGLLWWAGGSTPGSEARVQADGNLAIYGPTGQLLWFATPSPTAGSALTVDNDGSANLRTPTGGATWGSRTGPVTGRFLDPANPAAAIVGAAPANVPSQAWTAVQKAYSKVGSRYVFGTAGPTTFDCSGLTSWAYAQAGVSIPRDTSGQRTLTNVPASMVRPGDLLHYNSASSPSGRHVVLFVGYDTLGRAWTIEAKGSAYGVVMTTGRSVDAASLITRPVA